MFTSVSLATNTCHKIGIKIFDKYLRLELTCYVRATKVLMCVSEVFLTENYFNVELT